MYFSSCITYYTLHIIYHVCFVYYVLCIYYGCFLHVLLLYMLWLFVYVLLFTIKHISQHSRILCVSFGSSVLGNWLSIHCCLHSGNSSLLLQIWQIYEDYENVWTCMKMAFLHVQCCSAHWIWYDSFIASRKSSGSWALLVSASCSVGVLVSCTSRRHAGNSLVDLSGIQWHPVASSFRGFDLCYSWQVQLATTEGGVSGSVGLYIFSPFGWGGLCQPFGPLPSVCSMSQRWECHDSPCRLLSYHFVSTHVARGFERKVRSHHLSRSASGFGELVISLHRREDRPHVLLRSVKIRADLLPFCWSCFFQCIY